MNNDSHKGQFSGKLGIEDALKRLNAKMVYARIEPVELVSCEDQPGFSTETQTGIGPNRA